MQARELKEDTCLTEITRTRGEAAYTVGGANAPTSESKLSANNLKLPHMHPPSGKVHAPPTAQRGILEA
jgi:hypothetical protein